MGGQAVKVLVILAAPAIRFLGKHVLVGGPERGRQSLTGGMGAAGHHGQRSQVKGPSYTVQATVVCAASTVHAWSVSLSLSVSLRASVSVSLSVQQRKNVTTEQRRRVRAEQRKSVRTEQRMACVVDAAQAAGARRAAPLNLSIRDISTVHRTAE